LFKVFKLWGFENVFLKDYLHHPRNIGEKIRKYRMGSGLQIKELAKMIGVTEDTVINWEKRNIKPTQSNMDLIIRMIDTSK